MLRPKIACIGEVMIELSQMNLSDGIAHVGFAGDTFNTAVYLARLGQDVSYVTNLGRDAFSERILAVLAEESIDCSLVGRHDARLPGIYSIETDAQGERSFHYWRDRSAARTLFTGTGPTLAHLKCFDVIYLSGITLAILPVEVRMGLISTAATLKAAGKRVVFDTNFRPRLWDNEETARTAFAAMWGAASIALPSHDDEERLYPGQLPQAVIDRIAALGPVEVVLKIGAQGALVHANGVTVQTALPLADKVIDTSGAGDSFNAGYLVARLEGHLPLAAAEAGHKLAATVIGHHGAVISRDAMPA